jgi:hypothetical protein
VALRTRPNADPRICVVWTSSATKRIILFSHSLFFIFLSEGERQYTRDGNNPNLNNYHGGARERACVSHGMDVTKNGAHILWGGGHTAARAGVATQEGIPTFSFIGDFSIPEVFGRFWTNRHSQKPDGVSQKIIQTCSYTLLPKKSDSKCFNPPLSVSIRH